MAMTWMDHALVLAFALALPVWGYLNHEKFKTRVRAGIPGERLGAYAEAMIEQWLLVSAAMALWIHLDRDWTWIGLQGLGSRETWLALGVAVLISAFFLFQSAMVARRPETHDRVRKTLQGFAELLPAHRNELTGFIAVSLTAGVCEEILFRGVLGWYLGNWLGAWGGQAVAVVVFGAAHLFLGVVGTVRAMLAGAVFAGLFLWCGSLIPSILLHAVIDGSAGWMAYEVLRERPSQSAAAKAEGELA